MKNLKIWKIIHEENISINHYLKILEKKKIFLSPWIIDIFRFKKNNIKFTRERYYLYKIKVKQLGFKKPTKLKDIYSRIKKRGFDLVPPDIAIRTRLKYKEQKTGEWLRFATPLKSMIDRDGVPHLPKLGKALGKYFIETYWSYPKAIFFPHNEFVVAKKSETKKN